MSQVPSRFLSVVAQTTRVAFVLLAVHSLHCGSKEPAPASSGAAGLAGAGAAGTELTGGAGSRMTPDSGAGSGSIGTGGGWLFVDPTADAAVEGDGGCRRDVGFAAVTLTKPDPFDVVIVADHSDSLAWSRNELSTGLANLLSEVQGQDVRIFLLTPTQYGASSAVAQRPLSGGDVVAWQDPETGQAYSNAMTDYVQSCTDPSGATISCPSATGETPYKVQGTWQFKMPDPIVQITPVMTDAQFANAQKAVADAILALGGTGSPNEQPLCTLGRYVSQPASSLPKNVVFLILSDEDDVSLPADCLTMFTGELKIGSGTMISTCSSGCDFYRYEMTGDYAYTLYPMTCAAVDDLGNVIAGTETPATPQQAKECTTEGQCTDADIAQMAMFCESGKKIVSCDRRCSTGTTQCSLDLPNDTIDACSQAFTHNTRYENMTQYCQATYKQGPNWHDCKVQGYKSEPSPFPSRSGSFAPGRLVQGSKTADLGTYFTSKAKTAFASGKYLVEAIVFDPAFDCTLGKGQSYATNIAGVVGDRSRLFPLCKPYAPALGGVSTFAHTLIQTQFSVVLKSDEQITSMIVEGKNGSLRTIASTQYRYDSSSHTLTVGNSVLRATDATLRIEITSACRPFVH